MRDVRARAATTGTDVLLTAHDMPRCERRNFRITADGSVAAAEDTAPAPLTQETPDAPPPQPTGPLPNSYPAPIPTDPGGSLQ
ncbi:MAG: hypothetical protein ACK5MR_16910, partial [Cumulibacter sp.]